jgi:hypothetical protein
LAFLQVLQRLRARASATKILPALTTQQIPKKEGGMVTIPITDHRIRHRSPHHRMPSTASPHQGPPHAFHRITA